MEVGASIVSLLSVGATIATAINDFVTSCNNAPLFAQSVLHETLEFSYALSKLQRLVLEPQAISLDQSRTSMLDVNHLSLTLVGCVCTFSQLEKEIQRMRLSGKFGILDRVKWTFIERDVGSIIQRIQNHKMSLMLILTILRYVFKFYYMHLPCAPSDFKKGLTNFVNFSCSAADQPPK